MLPASGVVREGPGDGPQSSIERIFNEKNWLCWDVRPAVLTLFSLPQVFCGPQMCQKCVGGRRPGLCPGPRWGSSWHSSRPP